MSRQSRRIFQSFNRDRSDGVLEGMPLIDPTNAVTHGVGTLLTEHGESMPQRIAGLVPGVRGVKAFHLFPADQWTSPPGGGQSHVTVVMCGDDATALHVVGELVRDVGGVPATPGTLDRVRQLEEVAGFVIGSAFAGFDPGSAVPHVPSNDGSAGPQGEAYRPTLGDLSRTGSVNAA